MAPIFGLTLTGAAGASKKATVLTNEDGSQRITIKTASVEPGAAGEEFRIPLGPMDGGLAADRIQNARGYTGTSGWNMPSARPNHAWPWYSTPLTA